jgi:hypothetical protein
MRSFYIIISNFHALILDKYLQYQCNTIYYEFLADPI